MGAKKTVEFYVTLEPRWSRYTNHRTGEKELAEVKAIGLTQKRPERSSRGGTVVCKLTMTVPEAAFYPLRPEVVIDIPETLLDAIPIEVVALDPDDE